MRISLKEFFCCLTLLVSSFCPLAMAANQDDVDEDYKFDWLDPDKKIYVLQNRKYTKVNRLLLSLAGGFGISNPYRNARNLDVRMNYYFSESWGFEAFSMFTSNSRNGTDEALRHATTVVPVIREVTSQMGGLLHWAPWYAKINVFNTIIYFDWYFAGGLGVINNDVDTNTASSGEAKIEKQTYTGLFLGTGHQYHLSDHFIARIDFLGAFYKAPSFGTEGDKIWVTNYNFNFGIGYRF